MENKKLKLSSKMVSIPINSNNEDNDNNTDYDSYIITVVNSHNDFVIFRTEKIEWTDDVKRIYTLLQHAIGQTHKIIITGIKHTVDYNIKL